MFYGEREQITQWFLILLMVTMAQTLSSGAPLGACIGMTPDHSSGPQGSPSPFSVNASQVNSQSDVEVLVFGATLFKGALLQARHADDPKVILKGTFTVSSPGYHTMNCASGSNNAVTHSSPVEKGVLRANWLPPNGFTGNAVFRATVVRDYDTFWVNQDSNVIQIGDSSSSPETSITTIASTATTASTALTTKKVDYSSSYSGCGVAFACFGMPEGCISTKNCYVVVKAVTDTDGIMFTLIDHESSGPGYVALGFSTDNKMGDDSVVACISSSDIQVKVGWNYKSQYVEVFPTDNLKLLSGASASNVDGILKCTFKHVPSWKVKDTTFDFDKTDYHLLLASGQLNDNYDPKMHENYLASSNPIKISQFSVKGQDAIKSTYDGCGSQKGCFGAPNDCISTKNCEAFVSFSLQTDDVIFELIGRSSGYVAVGLSNDQRMGDDSVTACINSNNGVILKYAWNVDSPQKKAKMTSGSASGLIAGKFSDGTITCSFKRKIKTTIEGQVFNLNTTEYFLLLANGPVSSDGSIGNHLKTKWSSGNKLKLSTVSLLKGKKRIMIKIHGMLMIMAWVCTASIGMLFARYFKEVWTNKLVTGVKVWFFYHRVFMVSTFLLTAAAFIIIFLDVRGLSQVGDNPHPYLGIATTALCVLQPFIALCRCAPDSSNRPIFNWIHWFIGNAAQIIGIVTIFFSVELSKANLPQYFYWILIGFVASHVLFHVILQSIACATDGKKKKVGDMPMGTYGTASNSLSNITDDQKDVKGASSRKMTLIVYTFFNVGFVAALVVLIWIS